MHQLFYCDCCGESFRNVNHCREHERTHFKMENLEICDTYFKKDNMFFFPDKIFVCDRINKRQGCYELSWEDEYVEKKDKEI